MDYAGRLTRFRHRMTARELDSYYLTQPADIRYLTGFSGEDSALLVTGERCVLLTDSRFTEQAEEERTACEIMCRSGPMAKAVGTLLRETEPERLGMTSSSVTHAAFLAVQAEAPGTDAIACAEGITEEMRLCKDADEVAAIRSALELAERTFAEFQSEVRRGRTEKWLAARLEFEMRAAGADGASFPTICAVGANASKPHAVPTEAEVAARCGVLFDWGARLDGYCSDLTRMSCVGTIPRKTRELADIVMAAQEAAFGVLRPGCTCREADAAARDVVAAAGYGEFFGHGLGHGVGLEVHEAPRLAPARETVLAPGMVVTIEPGIYEPGVAGVRIEEMVLITPDGHEVLSTLPRAPGLVTVDG